MAAEAAATPFAVRAELAALTQEESARLFDRGRVADPGVERIVAALIDEVRRDGDVALREMAARFDGAALTELEVPRATCARALARLDPALRAALEEAAANITTFHRAQLPTRFEEIETLEVETAPGVLLGRRAEPLRRVGVYVPGGRAAYPSSVLMGVIPARVAAVREVLVCSPPGPDGLPPAPVLAACALAGADRVFAVGGAGAIAALALGTDLIPPADRIVGPGNAYVTEAKRQLSAHVGIDSPAGPSEILVLADDSADAELIGAELIAQAEHDPDAAAVLVTTHAAHIADVNAAVLRQLESQPRADIIRAALRTRGGLLLARDTDAALSFAERYAPEHLLVMTREPRALLPRLRAAGSIFLGASSSVAFGDYITGANHVLPTGGFARYHAGLSTLDFLRWTTYQEVSAGAAARLSAPTIVLADAEGLPAHALAARLRATDGNAPAAREASSSGAGPGPAAPSRKLAGRAAYRELPLYDPGRSPCDVDLSDNTNLFGPAPSIRSALASAAAATVTRYPSVYATDLKRALATLHGVEPANITTGCGSDDIIDSALRAFCETGDDVAYPDPTFGMIPLFSRMNALRTVPVPLTDALEVDADALVATRARVTYVCRPNNPTGNAFDRSAIERVCSDAAGLVLVDEAYADFAEDDMVGVAVRSERAVVLRTMSKAFGLAGLRIGYAIGPARLIAEIEKSRGPYKVGGVAEIAALAVLSHDVGWVRDRVADVKRNRARLLDALRERGLAALDSASNFVLVPVPGDARALDQALRGHGVATRPFAGLPRLGDCLRVSIGPWSQLERFLAALDAVPGSTHLVNA